MIRARGMNLHELAGFDRRAAERGKNLDLHLLERFGG